MKGLVIFIATIMLILGAPIVILGFICAMIKGLFTSGIDFFHKFEEELER